MTSPLAMMPNPFTGALNPYCAFLDDTCETQEQQQKALDAYVNDPEAQKAVQAAIPGVKAPRSAEELKTILSQVRQAQADPNQVRAWADSARAGR